MRGLIISILIISTINLSSCRNFLESGEKCQNELIADHCDNPSKSETSQKSLGFASWVQWSQSSQVVSIWVQLSPVESSQVQLIPAESIESNWVQLSPVQSSLVKFGQA